MLDDLVIGEVYEDFSGKKWIIRNASYTLFLNGEPEVRVMLEGRRGDISGVFKLADFHWVDLAEFRMFYSRVENPLAMGGNYAAYTHRMEGLI